jgi:ATP-dependent RNA helicase DDX27
MFRHNSRSDLSKAPVSVDDIIARRRLKSPSRKRKRTTDDEDAAESASDASSGNEEDDEDGMEEDAGGVLEEDGWEDEEDPLATSDEGEDEEDGEDYADAEDDGGSSSDESEPETQAEKDRKAAFFDSVSSAADAPSSFVSMNLSRPLLKALTSLGFHTPTPIQAATIPVALLGKDVVGNAVTGSGKTAAFIIPMLERLLYREKGKKAAATRCLVLVPTRELGVQCFEVGKKLAAHTDIQFCLAVGPLPF